MLCSEDMLGSSGLPRLLIQKKDSGIHYGIKSSVKIAHDQVQVYPQLLFQRLIIACDNSQLMWLKIPWL